MALQLEILSPSQTLYTGEADEVVTPSAIGQAGILPQHTDYLTALKEGNLVVRTGADAKEFQITGGFLVVAQDKVTVLIDSLIDHPA